MASKRSKFAFKNNNNAPAAAWGSAPNPVCPQTHSFNPLSLNPGYATAISLRVTRSIKNEKLRNARSSVV